MARPSKKPVSPAAVASIDATQAFAEAAAEIAAVADADLLQINIDIERAASIALASSSHLRALASAFKGLPDFDQEAPVRLRTYALAALYAHVAAKEAARDDQRFAPILEEAMRLRELLLGAAELLALFGMVSTDRVAEIRAGSGHLDTASDLIALRALFGDNWKQLAGRTPVTREQVDRAGVLGTEMHELVASRKFASPVETASDGPHKTRARAFSLLVRKYDACRRGVAYLRWEYGDAEAFTPSIYTRGRRRPSTLTEEVDTERADLPMVVPPVGVAPTPSGIGDVAMD